MVDLTNRNIEGGSLKPVIIGDVGENVTPLPTTGTITGGIINTITGITNPVTIQASDSPSIDAFARWRVSEPYTLFDSQLNYNAAPLFWDSILTGSGTAVHLPNEAAVRMRCTTANGDAVVRSTRRYIRYQPGKSQQILMTFVMGAAKANVTKRVGYFDASNGIFLEQTIAGLSIIRRTFVTGVAVDVPIAQAAWNIDPMNGTGPSGITLNMAASQILFIDLEWLGVGRVRVGFVINGIPYYAHEFLNTNSLSTVYMSTANLPLRYEIQNTAATASATDLYQICSSVASEGGLQERNITLSASNGVTLRTVANVLLPVLSIRVNTAYPSGGTLTNRTQALLHKWEVFTEDALIHYQIIYNGALTNPVWNAVNATYSGMDFDVAATAITGGIVLDSGYAVATQQAKSAESIEAASDLPLTLNAAGTVGDILSIACIRVTNTSSDTGCVLTWKALF